MLAVAEELPKFDYQLLATFAQWFDIVLSSNLSKESRDNFFKMLKAASPKEVGDMISNMGETLRKFFEDYEAAKKNLEEAEKKAQEAECKAQEAECKAQEAECKAQETEKNAKKTAQINIAKNLIRANLSFELIAESTDLTLEEVKKIAQSIDIDANSD